MPYIKPDNRHDLIVSFNIDNEDISYLEIGEINYLITKLVDAWIGSDPRYDDLNCAVGVLECAKMEFYRRIVAPYEDGKIAENGDVYTER